MSEKIYVWLLRLYPSSFQKAYGAEALLLFRDRARDERGFLAGLRLWLDLLSDLAISIPRAYRTGPAALVVSAAERGSDGTPSFTILEDEVLSFRSWLNGSLASLLVYGSIVFLLSHGARPIYMPLPMQQPPRSDAANPFSMDAPAAPRHAGAMAKPLPTITLACLPANPTPGTMVTLTATVLAVGTGPTPTGFVRIFGGSAVLDLAKLNQGAVIFKGKLPPDSASLSATYYGDGYYSPAYSLGATE